MKHSKELAIILLQILTIATYGATFDWNASSGDLDEATHWSPNADFSNIDADSYFMSVGDAILDNTIALGASLLSVGQNDGASACSLTVQSGGALIVNDLHIALGSQQTGTSSLTIMSGGSAATVHALIGHQSAGTLTIDSGATFSHSGDVRLGNAASSNGDIVNSGTHSSGNMMIMSENSGVSRYTLSGGTTTIRALDMDNGGSATVELTGSTGGFTLTGIGTPLSAASSTSFLNWTFDSSGVVALTLSGTNAVADISNATLTLSLGTVAEGTYTLIDNTHGGSLSGLESATISISGQRQGTVFEQNGDLLVTVTALTSAPSTTIILGSLPPPLKIDSKTSGWTGRFAYRKLTSHPSSS